MKKLDIFSYSPLQFRTWCGVTCSIITYALVILFGFIQFYEFTPRLMEFITPPPPTFMVGFQLLNGSSLEVPATWGHWEALTIEWTDPNNDTTFNITNTEYLTPCDDKKMCYNKKPELIGNQNTEKGSNLWITFVPCKVRNNTLDACASDEFVDTLYTIYINRTWYSDYYLGSTDQVQ